MIEYTPIFGADIVLSKVGVESVNSTPTSDTALPDIKDIHLGTLQLHGLIEALNFLMEFAGPKSAPIWAVVTSALPLARKISADLERVM